MEILVKSKHTRQISLMSVDNYEKQHPQFKEYFPIAKDFYQKYLRPRGKWSLDTAAHLLAHEDPEDHTWLADNGTFRSQLYRKIHNNIYQCHMNGEIELQSQTGRQNKPELVTENITFIRCAIKLGLINIPKILFDYANALEKIDEISTVEESNPSVHANSIIKDGEGYSIVFNNKKLPFLVASKGLEYLKKLLQNPHKEFSINELYKIASPNMPVEDETNIMEAGLNSFTVGDDTSNSSELIDNETRERYDDLEERIKQAILAEKFELAEKLEQQRNDLQQYILGATFKGRIKKFQTDTDSRRSTVHQSIAAIINKIGDPSPELGQHLTASIKKQRGKCCYQPEEAIAWYIPL